MHIQDRLRAALLQKRAPQVCWKCESGPRPQLRSIQTDQEARPGEDGTPKEAVPLLGGSQQRTFSDFPASSRSTKTRPANASRTVNKLSAKARHEDRDPDPKEVLPPIRLWPTHSSYPSVRPCIPIRLGYINHQTIQIRRRRVTFSTSDPLEARAKRPAECIVTDPALVARGTRFSRPTSATRIFPHRDTTDPSRNYVARLHTGIVQPGLTSNPTIASPLPYVNKVGIREHLRLWQELYDQEVAATSPPGRKAFQEPKLIENAVTQSGEDEARIALDSSDPALSRDLGLISVPNQEREGEADVGKFLRPGDVISCR